MIVMNNKVCRWAYTYRNHSQCFDLILDFRIFCGFFDDATNEVKHGSFHEEFTVFFGGIVFSAIPASLFVIVVSPEYQFFVFFELDEGYA